MNQWPRVKLTEICRPKQWPTISGSDLLDSGYPVYGANGKIGFYSSFNHEEPTILITCRGATCGTINVSESKSYVTGNAMALDKLHPQMDLGFLAHYLRHRRLDDVISGTAQPQITREGLANLTVPQPEQSQQRRIAAILDQAEALRAKRRKALAKLDTLTQSLFRYSFGDPEAGNSTQQRLGDLLDFLTSGSRGWASHYADVGAKFLRIQNVRAGRLECADMAYVEAPQTAEARRTKVVPGDVLLGITADLGRTAVVPAWIGEAYINQHLSILRSSRLNPEYLSSYLQSPGGRRQIMAKNREGVKAGLNFDDVRSIQIPVTPRTLQDAFSAAKVSLEKQRLRLQVAGKALEALVDSLHYQAFRGEL